MGGLGWVGCDFHNEPCILVLGGHFLPMNWISALSKERFEPGQRENSHFWDILLRCDYLRIRFCCTAAIKWIGVRSGPGTLASPSLAQVLVPKDEPRTGDRP